VTVNIVLYADLQAVAADADGTLDRAAEPCLYSRLDWFRLIHDHAPPSGKLEVVRVANDAEKSWLFLARTGSKAQAYASWYSLRFDAAGSHDPALLETLASSVGGARVELAPLADPEPLRSAFATAGWLVFLS